MGKDVDQVQTQCKTCQLATYREESYAIFNRRYPATKKTMKDTSLRDWQYVTFYITQKGYDEDPLRCLGPKEAKMMIKEVY